MSQEPASIKMTPSNDLPGRIATVEIELASQLSGIVTDDESQLGRMAAQRGPAGRLSSRCFEQRRREPRIQPIEDRAWLQWWDQNDLLGRSARLVNVSRRGAMIVTSAPLRVRQMLFLYLEEPAPQVGVRGEVLQVVEGFHGIHQIRLQFPEECPDLFFEAAANGFESWLKQGRTPPEETQS